MARTPKVPKPVDPLKSPAKALCTEVIRRFIKTETTIYWARELPSWYALWKVYPSLAFWMALELPFGEGVHGLNHISWFETPEGAAHLSRSWLLYHWNPLSSSPAPEPPPFDLSPSPLDSQTPSQLDCPIALPPQRPRTVAEWLGAKPPRSTP